MKEVGRKKPVSGPVYKILEGMSMERAADPQSAGLREKRSFR
jgi:hypothetical protein